MKQIICLTIILFVYSFYNISAQTTSPVAIELWDINSLSSIGGHSVAVNGNPVVVTDPQMGNAVKFDGNGDMLTVDAAPVGSATDFTVEVIFKPDGNALNVTNEPRFVCFWDPNDVSSGPRMTIELRVTTDSLWYFDGFLKTDAANLPLIDATKTHATGQWMHAAITYQNKTLTTYINGIQELTGPLNFTTKALNPTGKVSIGARYNKVNWYSGLIKTVKITQAALQPADFIVNTLPTSNPAINQTDKISIYPVPCNNTLNIEFKDANRCDPLNVSIFTLSGEKVLCENLNSKNTLNIENLKQGMYLVSIQSPGNVFTRKISIVR